MLAAVIYLLCNALAASNGFNILQLPHASQYTFLLLFMLMLSSNVLAL